MGRRITRRLRWCISRHRSLWKGVMCRRGSAGVGGVEAGEADGEADGAVVGVAGIARRGRFARRLRAGRVNCDDWKSSLPVGRVRCGVGLAFYGA